MADLVSQRWIEKFQQIQEMEQQPDLTWITSKLTLPADMQAQWTNDERTALSAGTQQHARTPIDNMCGHRCCDSQFNTTIRAGYACLNLAESEDMHIDSSQLQTLISACIGKDRCVLQTYSSLNARWSNHTMLPFAGLSCMSLS